MRLARQEELLDARLARNPKMCPVWVDRAYLRGNGGAVYISSISEREERAGMFHVYIWGRVAMGRSDEIRATVLYLMQRHDLDRAVGEIDTDNALGLHMARAAGFHEIGTMKRRARADGTKRDVVLFDAIPEDF